MKDVIDLLYFQAIGFDRTNLTPVISETIDLYTFLLKDQVIQWIKGSGHPNLSTVRGATVTEEEYLTEISNPLLRAKALLKAVTEFSTLPPGFQSITVSIYKYLCHIYHLPFLTDYTEFWKSC